MNDHWNILYQVSVFYARSEIQDGHHHRTYINIGPYGKMFKVEDHPRNIPAKFGSNWPSGFGEEA
jgi:hypothetical protein